MTDKPSNAADPTVEPTTPPGTTPKPTPTPTPDPPPETTSENKPPTPTTPKPDPPKSTPTPDQPADPTPTTPADNNDNNDNDDNNNDGSNSTKVVTAIVTRTNPTHTQADGTTPTITDPAQTNKAGSSSGTHGGLNNSGKIAIAVVVPVVAVALLLIAAIWFWRRRKARKDAEEERRKEVEDYAYNPNSDPTVPALGLASDPPYEMRDDATSGYRGWGSTTAAGSAAKAATSLSGGGHTAGAYSDTTTGAHAEPPRDGSYSPEGEILGVMGPSAAANRGGDIRRGPSNASSSYSAAGRSDGSDGGATGAYGNQYYDQYGGGNPYAGDGYNNGGGQQAPTELPGQAVIRDNPARRNTRIESPSHFPQQSAGISQNF